VVGQNRITRHGHITGLENAESVSSVSPQPFVPQGPRRLLSQ
jgi:hypothetical protein